MYGAQVPYDALFSAKAKDCACVRARNHCAAMTRTWWSSHLPSAPTPTNFVIASAASSSIAKTPEVACRNIVTTRPGNRYARERGYSRTLGQLIESKMALVAICRRCKHQPVLYPPTTLSASARTALPSNCASTCAAAAAGKSDRIGPLMPARARARNLEARNRRECANRYASARISHLSAERTSFVAVHSKHHLVKQNTSITRWS